MPRDVRAYLADIVESCEAITEAAKGRSLAEYQSNRLVRSSIEREFIIVGEAIAALSRTRPDLFDRISRARRIVDFRNRLTHEYPSVDDAAVWAIVGDDVPVLRSEVVALLDEESTGTRH
jgi:uncharacterized protein with HEPN domain